MGKASTNAGKDYYLRPDYQYLFDNINPEKNGIPLSTKNPIFMETIVKTEYKDKKGKDLYFKDEVELEENGTNSGKFIVDYDGKQFKWVIKNDKKTIILKDVTKMLILSKKYKNR